MKKTLFGFILVAAVVAGAGWLAVSWNQDNELHTGGRNLVALGDSVTAGDGLPLTRGDSRPTCRRSDQAYPRFIALEMNYAPRSYACSGAKVSDMLQQIVDAKQYLPGSDVVLTVGANDSGSLLLLARCVQKSACLTDDQVATFDASLTKLSTDLVRAIGQIQAAKPNKIVLNTYYQLLSDKDSCYAQYGVTPEKITVINRELSKLNDVIRATGKQTGASVVNVDFSGHSLCAAKPWVQGVIARSPLHPTVEGQQQIAKQDVAALSDQP